MEENKDDELANLRNELIGHGLYEIGMHREDMINLLSAIRNSEESAKIEDNDRDKDNVIVIDDADVKSEEEIPQPPVLKRKYKNSPERRMPWVLFPQLDKLTLEQKSKILLKYKEQMNVFQYRRARSSTVFAEWNHSFGLPLWKQKNSPDSKRNVHHTRSGRTVRCTPRYVDDLSDSETGPSEKKSRKRMKKSQTEDAKPNSFSSCEDEKNDITIINDPDNSDTEKKNNGSSISIQKDHRPRPAKISKDSSKLPLWDVEL